MTTLKPLMNYNLELTLDANPSNAIPNIERLKAITEFMNQPLKVFHFVPCWMDGKNGWIPFNNETRKSKPVDFKTACEKLLFKNCKYIGGGTIEVKTAFINSEISTIFEIDVHTTDDDFEYNLESNDHPLTSVESLCYWNIELTDNAIEQIS